MKEAFVFEVGKCYEHNTGKRIHIVAEAELDIYFSPCLIAETDSGSIISVGKSEENAVNYHEITREEWLNTFKSSFVSEVEAEYGSGWIPVEKALPKERDWYLAMFKEPDTGFMGLPFIADYLMGVHTKYTTEDGWIIANCTDIEDERAEYYKKLVCVAWMPLPEGYKPQT